jgi:hypothetical protein
MNNSLKIITLSATPFLVTYNLDNKKFSGTKGDFGATGCTSLHYASTMAPC